mmetsp:Transcript_131/g.302  ORF Transcript_131/g.302 Transcript_131/m.302 type:complete len:580 (+) Transcript_131:954-2693(+)
MYQTILLLSSTNVYCVVVLCRCRLVEHKKESSKLQTRMIPGVNARQKKFLLLPAGDMHDVVIFDSLKPGTLQDETLDQPRSSCKPVLPIFVGRSIEVQSIVRVIVENRERWVNLYGKTGIGKSSIACAVSSFLCLRRACKRVIFIPLALSNFSADAPSSLVSLVGTCIFPKQDINEDLVEAVLFSEIIRLVENSPYDGPMIFVFDGCEQWVDKFSDQCKGTQATYWQVLSHFILELLSRTRGTVVLSTNRFQVFTEYLTPKKHTITPKEVEIGPLSNFHSAKLLSKLCRRSHHKLEPKEYVHSESWHIIPKLDESQKFVLLGDHLAVQSCKGHPCVIKKIASVLLTGVKLENATTYARNILFSLEKEDQSSRPPRPPPNVSSFPWQHVRLTEIVQSDPKALVQSLWSVTRPKVVTIINETLYEGEPKLARKVRDDDIDRMEFVLNRSQPMEKTLEGSKKMLLVFWKWFEAALEMLLHFRTYWDQSVIFGFVSKEKVVEKLVKCQPGTFLVRVSESVPGALALAYHAQGRVNHSLVKTFPDGSVEVSVGRTRPKFASLRSLLASMDVLKYVWPDRNKNTL